MFSQKVFLSLRKVLEGKQGFLRLRTPFQNPFSYAGRQSTSKTKRQPHLAHTQRKALANSNGNYCGAIQNRHSFVKCPNAVVLDAVGRRRGRMGKKLQTQTSKLCPKSKECKRTFPQKKAKTRFATTRLNLGIPNH